MQDGGKPFTRRGILSVINSLYDPLGFVVFRCIYHGYSGRLYLIPHTVPRLELCAAVLAVELAELITEESDIALHKVRFYTDSRIILGYIHSVTCWFYVYVANRVTRIRKSPDQWRHVSTDQNPADQGTRCIQAAHLNAQHLALRP